VADRDNPFGAFALPTEKKPPADAGLVTPRTLPNAIAETGPSEEPGVAVAGTQRTNLSDQPAVAAKSSRIGRPREGREFRIVGYVTKALSDRINRLEHLPRSDGTYFASQSDLVNRLLQAAMDAVDSGELTL
jgi:hypothetical protein